MPATDLREYDDVRGEIRDLDVVAFRGGHGPMQILIRVFTGSGISHVGLAVWVGRRLMLLESKQLGGVKLVWMSRELRRRAAYWHQPEPPLTDDERAKGVDWALQHAGEGYSFLGLLGYLSRLAPRWLAWAIPGPRPDGPRLRPRFCSELVAAVYQNAGRDLRPDLRDSLTSPRDLLESPALRSRGRIRASRRRR